MANNKELLKPQTIPEPIAKYLIANLKVNVSWVYNLKSVMKPDTETEWNFRLFEEKQVIEKRLKVKDYASLDGQPGLVKYEGRFNPKSSAVEIVSRN